MNYHLILEIGLKLFFMLTPFFVLSMFVTITADMAPSRRKAISKRASVSIVLVCLILYFFGRQLFDLFGITVDSFRIGSGVILMLTAIEQVRGNSHSGIKHVDDNPNQDVNGKDSNNEDIAIVPLTIPYVVGPGTIGMLLVLGGEILSWEDRLASSIGIILAGSATGAMLYFSDFLMRHLGSRSLQILSKITGLVLAAISAQSIMAGVLHMLKG